MFILYGIWGEVLAQSIMLGLTKKIAFMLCAVATWRPPVDPILNPEVDHSLFGQLVQRAQLLLFTAIRPQFFPINPL